MNKREERRARKCLAKAAGIIEEHGWCQGSYQDNGHYCAMGAIYAASGGDSGVAACAEVLLAKSMRLSKWVSVPMWNDRYSQTKAKVVRALRRAAGDQWA